MKHQRRGALAGWTVRFPFNRFVIESQLNVAKTQQKQFSTKALLAYHTFVVHHIDMKYIFAALIAIVSFGAAAHQPGDITWDLLGPAFSQHASNEGSYITKPSVGTWTEAIYTSPDGSMARRYFHGTVTEPEYGWNQSNFALGVQRSVWGDGVRDFDFVEVVQDSYAQWGVMAGHGRAWSVGQLGSFKFETGIAGGLWYRTWANGLKSDGTITACAAPDPWVPRGCSVLGAQDRMVTNLERVLTPFVMPVITVKHGSGMGVAIGFAPEIHIDGIANVPTTTLMLQTTFEF
jgi:hypothetical protein